MSQTLLEMAKDLVDALIRAYNLPPDEVTALLQRTHATLVGLHQSEAPSATDTGIAAAAAAAPVDWKRSIQRHSVTCLECGATFKQLSARHLRTHDLDPRSYRAKYGIPRTQALSARAVTVRRRQLAKQIRPWEQAHTGRDRAKR